MRARLLLAPIGAALSSILFRVRVVTGTHPWRGRCAEVDGFMPEGHLPGGVVQADVRRRLRAAGVKGGEVDREIDLLILGGYYPGHPATMDDLPKGRRGRVVLERRARGEEVEVVLVGKALRLLGLR